MGLGHTARKPSNSLSWEVLRKVRPGRRLGNEPLYEYLYTTLSIYANRPQAAFVCPDNFAPLWLR